MRFLREPRARSECKTSIITVTSNPVDAILGRASPCLRFFNSSNAAKLSRKGGGRGEETDTYAGASICVHVIAERAATV